MSIICNEPTSNTIIAAEDGCTVLHIPKDEFVKFLDKNPTITQVITTGEKATGIIASQAGVEIPVIGVPVKCRVGCYDITLWRMPSSSRAYPLALEKKAEAYRKIFGL